MEYEGRDHARLGLLAWWREKLKDKRIAERQRCHGQFQAEAGGLAVGGSSSAVGPRAARGRPDSARAPDRSELGVACR
jgi:hypothetical protein